MSRLEMFFSNRSHGNMGFGFGPAQKVVENRYHWSLENNLGIFVRESGFLRPRGFSPKLGLTSEIKTIREEDIRHCRGIGIAEVSHVECDAIAADISGYPLLFLVADCPLIVLHDEQKRISSFSVFHGGRSNILQNIAEKTVAEMTEQFECNPADLIAYFFPGICGSCYRLEYLPPNFPEEYERLAPITDGSIALNLKGIILHQLIQSGVKKFFFPMGQNECTCCTPVGPNGKPKYFSHYGFEKKIFGHRDPGRNALVVAMM